jgi:hypothetical protein
MDDELLMVFKVSLAFLTPQMDQFLFRMLLKVVIVALLVYERAFTDLANDKFRYKINLFTYHSLVFKLLFMVAQVVESFKCSVALVTFENIRIPVPSFVSF